MSRLRILPPSASKPRQRTTLPMESASERLHVMLDLESTQKLAFAAHWLTRSSEGKAKDGSSLYSRVPPSAVVRRALGMYLDHLERLYGDREAQREEFQQVAKVCASKPPAKDITDRVGKLLKEADEFTAKADTVPQMIEILPESWDDLKTGDTREQRRAAHDAFMARVEASLPKKYRTSKE